MPEMGSSISSSYDESIDPTKVDARSSETRHEDDKSSSASYNDESQVLNDAASTNERIKFDRESSDVGSIARDLQASSLEDDSKSDDRADIGPTRIYLDEIERAKLVYTRILRQYTQRQLDYSLSRARASSSPIINISH